MSYVNSYPAKSETVRWIDRKGETIVLEPKSGIYHRLNLTASSIWQLCDGSRNVEEISKIIELRYSTKGINTIKDVLSTVRYFKKTSIVELRKDKNE